MSEHRLSEIVIERPRVGMRISRRKLKGFKKQLQKLTEDASHDGLLSPYLIKPRNKSKYLSDHLGPLRRFLRSHVGQPWNDVYSKLCQQLNSNTMAGQHVLDHVDDYVERHVELIDGVPYYKSRRHLRLSNWRRFQLYVHPETGILCDVKDIVFEAIAPSLKPSRRLDVVELDKFHQYRRIDDIWYLITYREVPATEIVFDVLNRAAAVPYANRYGNRLYAAHKRQCNKREIRIIQKKLNYLE
jgi:hypothetical protein